MIQRWRELTEKTWMSRARTLDSSSILCFAYLDELSRLIGICPDLFADWIQERPTDWWLAVADSIAATRELRHGVLDIEQHCIDIEAIGRRVRGTLSHDLRQAD
jgi:hypothetical protein